MATGDSPRDTRFIAKPSTAENGWTALVKTLTKTGPQKINQASRAGRMARRKLGRG